VIVDVKHRGDLSISGTGKLVEPRDGCSSYKYKYTHEAVPTIYFIAESGDCPLASKINLAQKANA
jgi:hypothetical protein